MILNKAQKVHGFLTKFTFLLVLNVFFEIGNLRLKNRLFRINEISTFQV